MYLLKPLSALLLSWLMLLGTAKNGERSTKVSISDSHAMEMYQKWAESAISSLFSAIAHKKLKRKRRSTIHKFARCNGQAEVIQHQAKCLDKLINNGFERSMGKKLKPDYLKRYKFKGKQFHRSKRNTRPTEHYAIPDRKEQITPLGTVAKLLIDELLTSRNKTKLDRWQNTVTRLKEISEARDKRREAKKKTEDSEEILNQFGNMAFRRAAQKENDDEEMRELFKDKAALRKFLQKSKATKQSKPEKKILQLIRDSVKLAYSMAGKNITNFDEKNMKIASPRFMGVVKNQEKEDDIDLLSPSLFSLHNEGVGVEKMTSLPRLLQSLDLKDQQLMLDFIMEAAGVNDEKNKLDMEEKVIEVDGDEKKVNVTNFQRFKNDKGQPLFFSKSNLTEIGAGDYDLHKVEYYEKFVNKFELYQLKELNSSGFALLTPNQIHELYGPHSPFNNSEAHKNLKGLSKSEVHMRIADDIKLYSENEKFQIRQKDIVLSPIVATPLVLAPYAASQAIVLSPLVLSPVILSYAVLGPVVLSPWVFVPVILSPRLLSPLIISPFVLSPVILSPLALHPVVLSPGVFSPVILTPFVLSPLILSPLVFVPIILSPIALSPAILVPGVGSPIILSPFVLTPFIFSPQALSALVLSPYALSPIIASELIVFAAVLSPSFLS